MVLTVSTHRATRARAQALARVDRGSWRRGMSRGRVERVAAARGRPVRTWTPAPAYLLVFLVLPVSYDPHRPTRSTLHSPHLARRVDQARELRRGGAITDFVAAAAPGGGGANDRMYGIARPYASSPPARRMVTGAAQPLHRQ